MQIGAWRKNSLEQVAATSVPWTPGYSEADDDPERVRELGDQGSFPRRSTGAEF